MPNGIVSISASTFYACSKLEKIELSETVATIGKNAFYGCNSLKYLKLGHNITSIDATSFTECNLLTVGVYKDSYALTYAIENSIPYYLLIDEHRCVKDNSVDATCENDGYTVYSCVDCDFTTHDNIVNKLNHKWDSGIITTEATCTADGVKTFTCDTCQMTKTEIIKALGHNYSDDWTINKEPTCTKPGIKEKVCSVCGDKVTEQIAAIGHDYDFVVVAATCTTDGYTLHTCKTCNDSYRDNVVSATGHKYGEWNITKEATCTKTGTQEKVCSSCGDKVTETIAKIDHDYTVSDIVEPTCTTDGYTTYVCTVCNDSYRDDIIKALGHVDDDGDGICDFCDSDVNADDPDDPVVNCTCNCHKSGIVNFFWKIANFFHKLFGMDQYRYCSCGRDHWTK